MQLAVIVMGEAKNHAINEMIQASASNQCRIVDIHSSVYHEIACAHLLVEGNWNQLSKFESTLHAIEKRRQVKIFSVRPEKQSDASSTDMPYQVEIIALEAVDLLHQVVLFFAKHHVNIQQMNAYRYHAPKTNTPLFLMKFAVSLPHQLSALQIRDELMYLCDESNADLMFDPFRFGGNFL